jgi:hypothetical protein
MEHRWNEIDRGKPKYSGKNPTWTDPGSNPGLRGERPATNRLSHSTARFRELVYLLFDESKGGVRQVLLYYTKRIH